MSTHTPGPWEVSYSTNFPDQQTVQAEGSDRILALIDRADEQDYANARLIAAAPDLLSVLKEAMRPVENWACNCEINGEGGNTPAHVALRHIREAIAKAEGRD